MRNTTIVLFNLGDQFRAGGIDSSMENSMICYFLEGGRKAMENFISDPVSDKITLAEVLDIFHDRICYVFQFYMCVVGLQIWIH